jgi:hypothetical protein
MTSPRSQAGYAPVNGLEMYYEIHHHRHEAPQAAVFVRPWVDIPWDHAEKIPLPNGFKVASSLIRFRYQRRLVPARGARLKNGPPAEGLFAKPSYVLGRGSLRPLRWSRNAGGKGRSLVRPRLVSTATRHRLDSPGI